MKPYVLAGLLAAFAGGAIAQAIPQDMSADVALKLATCDECGQVSEVRKLQRKGEGGAVGIVSGAALGGLLGNQIGKGTGRTVATVAGAVAGGFAGNEVQKHVTGKDGWATHVKMRDGSTRVFEQEQEPTWKTGEYVRVSNNALAPL